MAESKVPDDDDAIGGCEYCGGPPRVGEEAMVFVAPNPDRTENQVKLFVHEACWEAYRKAIQ